MRVLSVIHGPTVRSELFGDVIREEGHELVEWEIGAGAAAGGRVRRRGSCSAATRTSARRRSTRGSTTSTSCSATSSPTETPLLRVCLGAQTLAHAFGGRVAQLARQQAGFEEVWLTDEGRDDPVLGVLPERFEALVGNAYGFELPGRAVGSRTRRSSRRPSASGSARGRCSSIPRRGASRSLDWFAEDGRRPAAAARRARARARREDRRLAPARPRALPRVPRRAGSAAGLGEQGALAAGPSALGGDFPITCSPPRRP